LKDQAVTMLCEQVGRTIKSKPSVEGGLILKVGPRKVEFRRTFPDTFVPNSFGETRLSERADPSVKAEI
jgi:hypothetical protein